jgi:hypothetical protein
MPARADAVVVDRRALQFQSPMLMGRAARRIVVGVGRVRMPGNDSACYLRSEYGKGIPSHDSLASASPVHGSHRRVAR